MSGTGVTDDYVRGWLIDLLASYMEVPVEEVDPEANFLEIGLDSLYRWEIGEEISRHFNVKLEKSAVLNKTTIDALAGYVHSLVTDGSKGSS